MTSISSSQTTNDQRLLEKLVAELSAVPGIRTIALGGSRARGTATENSDYDLGLYYEPDDPLDVAALQRAATVLDDSGTVTPIDGWGPWINGGGWLTVDGRRVDLLYRDLGRVRGVIDDCCAGRVEQAYQPGYPHAFSAIYMGEVAYCLPLWDRTGILGELKALTKTYPEPLRATLTQRYLAEAEFSIENAKKSCDRDDANYVIGCAFRTIACLCQVLFALNGQYLLNERALCRLLRGWSASQRIFRAASSSRCKRSERSRLAQR